MQIAGIQTISLIDYPGKVCTTIFTLGCNFRCPYCHNKQISFDFAEVELIEKTELFKILDDRKEFIDAVSISGGEPTIQPKILDFCSELKERYGFLIKFDTNGSKPKVIEQAIEQKLLDYVALDIKTSFNKYKEHLGIDGKYIYDTYKIISSSNIGYELRMTCFPEFIHSESILELLPLLNIKDRIYLQQCYLKVGEEDSEEHREAYEQTQLELFENLMNSSGFKSASLRNK